VPRSVPLPTASSSSTPAWLCLVLEQEKGCLHFLHLVQHGVVVLGVLAKLVRVSASGGLAVPCWWGSSVSKWPLKPVTTRLVLWKPS
jgi:hypothetical protein